MEKERKTKVIIIHGNRYQELLNLKVLTAFLKKATREGEVSDFDVMTTIEATQLNGDRDYKFIFLAEQDFSTILEMAKNFAPHAKTIICSTTTLEEEESRTNKIGAKFIEIPIIYPSLLKALQ